MEENGVFMADKALKKKIFILAPLALLGVFSIFYKFGLFSAIMPNNKKTDAPEVMAVETAAKTEGPRIGALAPDFTALDLQGNKAALNDLISQKPVLLIFWATWCGYCAKELPDLKTFTKNRQNQIQVVTIASGEVKSTVNDYVKEKDVNFMMLLDEKKEIWNTYLVRGTPSHFLINKQGEIVTMLPGLASLDNLETMLKMVIN